MTTYTAAKMDNRIICVDCGKLTELCAKGLCRSCYNRRWYLEHREQRKQQMRAWEKKNHEKRLKQKRRYYQENREYFHSYYKQYWKNHPSYDPAHYKENREKIRAYHRQWCKNNPEKTRVYAARKYAKRSNLPNTLTTEQAERLLMIGRNTYPGQELHLDHVVPINKGGGTTLANIHAIPKPLNIWKKDRLPKDIYEQLKLWPQFISPSS